ncbi:penicillin-binding protein 3 [Halolactibacillus miurensis]|uniref:serine-type D-Ala-D-Ala carboxypeptidase n=1 Tax=Halolactibacillus miurensis TaxID=306541 RepID=A0A1I6TKS5_9BACI|nr:MULTISPECIES: penicillin-binding transpeptidase domain-containing protein [Halolactibacillus]GEM04753.1 penicillin-binding protein 3 [Halolactibacillus miurensis]SFS89852.1 penicillin-binding protein [Halolactibacillus miurensis]
MRKLVVILCISLFSLIACSEETIEPKDPKDDLNAYVEAWERLDFNAMQSLVLASDDASTLTEQYETAYDALGTTDVAVSITDEPQLDRDPDRDEYVVDTNDYTYTLTITQNTLVGDYSFDTAITLTPVIETIDDTEQVTHYQIIWDKGLIIPPLKDGGEIKQIVTEPIRGNIFDRNGEALAVNGEMREIGVDTGRFVDRATEIEFISKALDMTVDQIEHTLSQSWVQDGLFIPLKRVSVTEEEKLAQLNEIPSVLSTASYGRVYPEGETMSHLVGYVGTVTAEDLENDEDGIYSDGDMIGKRGIEYIFEEQLRGEDGIRLVVDNNGNRTGIVEQDPVDGEDIHLTIDRKVQSTLFNQFVEGDAGHATIIDPKTSETLALVSYPSFDPTLFTEGMSQEVYDGLNNDPLTPLLNRFQSTYSPGSVFKPVTAMIGLHTGSFTPTDTLDIDGYTYNQPSFGNYEVRRVSLSDGPVDLHDALVRSDNIYFARQALNIGAENFLTTSQLFGFNNDAYTFSYPIRQSQVANDETLSNDVLLADTGYGQGQVLVSSHHLAMMYTPLFHNGNMMTPILLKGETSEILTEHVISEADVTALRQALYDVVQNGTATIAKSDTVTLSGKTGTAELKQSASDENKQENGWFVGYDDESRYLITMMIESVESKGGSRYPAEKVRQAFEALVN